MAKKKSENKIKESKEIQQKEDTFNQNGTSADR